MRRNTGNNHSEAQLIGANETASGLLGRANKSDFFQINITSQRNFRAALTGVRNNVDLALFQGGRRVARSNQGGRRDEAIDVALNPGTYFLQVVARSGATRYRLQVATSDIAPLPNPTATSLFNPISTFLPNPTPTSLFNPIATIPGSGEQFFSYEFGYERLPTDISELSALIPSVASFLGDEPDYFRALNVQYPSVSVSLAASAMSLFSSRELGDFSVGRPNRLFINSRGETVSIPGTPGLDGSQPFGEEIIYFPLWFS